jgi:hypothetical protein
MLQWFMFATTGVGSTCSPRKTGLGCTRGLPANRCELYFEPAKKNRRNPSRMNTYANAPLTPVECALTKSLAKSRGMNTYRKVGGGEVFGCGLYLQPAQMIVTQQPSPARRPRQTTNHRISIHFPTLCALFCTRAKINSFAFRRLRTILEKRGYSCRKFSATDSGRSKLA